MARTPDRRRAPRLAVRSQSTLKIGDTLVAVHLRDISPVGARLAMADAPAVGTAVKLYTRGGQALDAVVVRPAEGGVALRFAETAPPELPYKTVFWKLDSYVFAKAPAPRSSPGRHRPDEAMIETCTVVDWALPSASIDTPRRLPLGTRVHVCGAPFTVVAKQGQRYELSRHRDLDAATP